MISPDGNTVRKLTARNFMVFAVSKDGQQVYGIFRKTIVDGTQWLLNSMDVNAGVLKMLSAVDPLQSSLSIANFSLFSNGKSFLTPIAKRSRDI